MGTNQFENDLDRVHVPAYFTEWGVLIECLQVSTESILKKLNHFTDLLTWLFC